MLRRSRPGYYEYGAKLKAGTSLISAKPHYGI